MEINNTAINLLRQLGDFVKAHPLYDEEWIQDEIWFGSQKNIREALEETLKDENGYDTEYMLHVYNHKWDNHKKVYCEPWFTIYQNTEIEVEPGLFMWELTDAKNIKLSNLYI